MRQIPNIAPIVGLCVLVAACAPAPDVGTTNIFTDMQTVSTSGQQSAQQRALSQRQNQYAQTRVNAAVGGMALGILGCALADCDSEQYAAVAVAGAAAGYMTGGYLTNQNQAFHGSQETLRRDIQLAAEDNQKLAQSVAAAEQVVAFQRSEISRLNQAYAAGAVSADQYRTSLATMQGDVRATQALINTSTGRLNSLNNSINNHARSGLPTQQLVAQRNQQQVQLQRLREAEQAMLANISHAQVRT